MPAPNKTALERPDGLFDIITTGLAPRQRDLEILDLPRPALEAAAKLIDSVHEVLTRTGGTLVPGQNVGVPQSVEGHPEHRAVCALVHGIAGSDGRIRLVDILDRKSTPRWAISSVLLFRAKCRLAIGDARAADELRTALELFPGDPAAGPPIPVDVGDAGINWQNVECRQLLASLEQDDARRAALENETYTKFSWLAMETLGATAAELASLQSADVHALLTRIVTHNAATKAQPGPTPTLRILASPMWSSIDGATSVRRGSLVPASIAAYVLAPAGRATPWAVAASVDCVLRFAREPGRLVEIVNDARELFEGPEAPVLEEVGRRHPAALVASAVYTSALRLIAGGASEREVRVGLGLIDDAAASASLRGKLDRLEQSEANAQNTAIRGL